MDQNNTSK